MKINIVVGLGFGDEGKGAAIASKCLAVKTSHQSQIVVRFNGGQQAGHTVYLDAYKKHIHSSFGSGGILGIPTYISEHCTVYLPSLIEEAFVLKKLIGKIPKIYIHPDAMLTIPSDVLQDKLIRPAKNGHATVGTGHGKTKERHNNMNAPHSRANLLLLKGAFKRCLDKFSNVIKTYASKFPDQTKEELDFFSCWPDWSSYIEIADYRVLQNYANIHFEGAQGAMLDMRYGEFPYVTHSHTTVKNAYAIINTLPSYIDPNISIYYCTRAYLTRHGEGPFNNSGFIDLINNSDESNKLNPYQGEFKTAPLDINILNYGFMVNELEIPANYRHKTISNLIVSCCDQLKEGFDDSVLTKLNFHHRLNDIILRNSPISKPIH